MWGALSYEGLGPLYRVNEKMTSETYSGIIQNILLPYVLDGPFPDGLFHLQQDGAPVHTAKAVQTTLEELGIMTLPWPSRSPDLNIIENVWGIMKNNLARQPGLGATTANELWTAIEAEWHRLRQLPNLVDSLYDSLPGRIAKVQASGGDPIDY